MTVPVCDDNFQIYLPSDLHLHFRHPKDPRFPIAVKAAANLYYHVTAMPNLGPDRIRTTEGARRYKDAIESLGRNWNSHFTVNVPLYLEPDTSPQTIYDGNKTGAFTAVKLYPKGGTTQSDEGVDFRDLWNLDPVFAAMQEVGMTLLVHAEPVFDGVGGVIDPFHRESNAIPYLRQLIKKFPKLRIVFEHISSEDGAKFVRRARGNGCLIEATIAPQYLVWTRTKLFEEGMNPEFFSIPLLKEEKDRAALIEFMLDGYGFLGTDSAPHMIPSKSKPCGCAGGVFNAPVGLYVYFDIFRNSGREDWLARFIDFACFRGPKFYGLSVEKIPMFMLYDPWKMPTLYGEGKEAIIPMFAGQTINYRLSASMIK